MLILIAILTAIFWVSPFLGTLSFSISNPLVAFLFYQANVAIGYFAYFFFGFCAIVFFFIRKDWKHLTLHKLLAAIVETVTIVVASLLTSFALLMLVAWVELTLFAAIMNINPEILGVTSSTKTIVKLLQSDTTPPRIIASNRGQKEAIAIAQAASGSTNLYGNILLPSIPDIFIFPIKTTPGSFLFLDNALVVTRIDAKDLQEISPTIGHLFVQSYFPDILIKSYPTISVMSENEYLSFRKKDVAQKVKTVADDVVKMENGVASVSAQVQKDTLALADNKQQQQDAMDQRNKQYNTCLSTGTYVKDIFQPTYTKDYCQKYLTVWEQTLDNLSQEEDTLTKKQQSDEQILKTYQYYETFFKTQQKLMTISNNNIPSELGEFIPGKTIKIVINTNSTHKVGDYFETLVHEYLHYASYTAGKRLDSSFFEEGLTEYFARQIIADYLNEQTNIGYPVAVKIISAITDKIAEPDLAKIYFTKDQVGLQNELDLVYGDNFYKNNFVSFESLQYTTDPTQTLTIANNLLKKLGEKPLTTKDLYSQSSL